jgi:tetratricopeptide (TPR) repeat protein
LSQLLFVLRRNLAEALGGGNLDEAAAILERLRREDPLSVHTRGAELELLLRAGRLDEAAVLADQLTAAFPTSARVFYLAGRVAYRRRTYAEAQALLEESLRIAPHWKARHWLGKTLTQAGRLAEAEPLLLEAAQRTAIARRDLAWLYERMDDGPRALAALETYLAEVPGDEFAKGQLQRLRARALEPERLLQEVETLAALGEEVPIDILPEYVEGLLRAGQGGRAREVVAACETSLDARTATRLAWACHRLQAADLACRLFLRALQGNLHSPKTLSALEGDAARAGRLAEVAEAYQALVDREPRLWGRLRRVRARLRATP